MMLQVEDLHAGYGNVHVLNGVGFSVASGEIVTILGRNGSGRSITCKAIMGLLTPSRGSVRLGERVGRGEIVFSGTVAAFNADEDVRKRWLEVH